MLLESTGGHPEKNSSLNRVTSSSSRSLSSPSPFSPSSFTQPPRSTKTMEEVWKDINLASLNEHNTHTTITSSNFRNMILQDFLAQPSTRNPQTSITNVSVTESPVLYGSASTVPPPPTTILSLNYGPPEFHLHNNPDPISPRINPSSVQLQCHSHHHPASKFTSFESSPFEGLGSASDVASLRKKRFSETDTNSGDRINKRVIKNRESAARSRARKQAYTNELELEVAHLLEENARLKRQQEQLCLAASAQQTKKHSLNRTSTAPF
ncbi:ABSCISIC ACID-INSENSITIVE 5-like protein 2 [Quillaja saponaria]|uniref:ABSCISIC ACID-INSENSITIVE 5-like protein 2 n=1 Tax=Quillaja saponaria TaxID=32244 RepID=A0AAD7P6K8_QUISA|nr:ABSCISIC ACID-INSENSITIVE 5-like protein 2 [Quillaja saponaria]